MCGSKTFEASRGAWLETFMDSTPDPRKHVCILPASAPGQNQDEKALGID